MSLDDLQRMIKLRLDRDLWTRVKMRAAERDTNATQLVREMLEHYMKDWKSKYHIDNLKKEISEES